MTIYYSPTKKGFYDSAAGYASYPQDIIEISPEKHTELLDGVNLHQKEIFMDEDVLSLRDKPVVVTWDIIRYKRNNLLTSSDYTQMSDWPGDKTAWAVYRQQLRELPQLYSKPENVVFPTPPGA